VRRRGVGVEGTAKTVNRLRAEIKRGFARHNGVYDG
jgi:hypothetical protein